MNAEHVSWRFELIVKTGREADLRTLIADMVHATRDTESGAVDYEWYLSRDGRQCHIVERYADSAAALAHLRTFRDHYLTRFFDAMDPVRLVIYAAPDDVVCRALEPLSPVVFTCAAGFSRRAATV